MRPGLLLDAGLLQTHAHRGPGGPQHDNGGPLRNGVRAQHARRASVKLTLWARLPHNSGQLSRTALVPPKIINAACASCARHSAEPSSYKVFYLVLK